MCHPYEKFRSIIGSLIILLCLGHVCDPKKIILFNRHEQSYVSRRSWFFRLNVSELFGTPLHTRV